MVSPLPCICRCIPFRSLTINLEFLSRHRYAQVFSAGGYFGVETLATPNVYNADIKAQTNLHVIVFNRADLLFLLEDTDVIERTTRIQQRHHMHMLGAIRKNNIFGRMSEIQKIQLEESFQELHLDVGDTVWNFGDPATSAILVAKGCMAVDYSQTLAASSLMDGPPAEITDEEGNVRKISAPRITSRRRMRSKRSSYGSMQASLQHQMGVGSFVGAFDALLATKGDGLGSHRGRRSVTTGRRGSEVEGGSMMKGQGSLSNRNILRAAIDGEPGTNVFSLRATEPSIALQMNRLDFVRFFTNNPGILLSIVGKDFLV